MNPLARLYRNKSVVGYYDTARIDAVRLISDPVERVLEVGCGAGATLAYLKEHGLAKYVVGVDINEEELKKAKSKGVDEVVHASLGDDGFSLGCGSFDYILCLDVLEHMVDPWRALDALVPLVRPGGRIVASIPNVQNVRVIVPLIFGRWIYRECGILDQTHLRFFTKRSSVQLFEEAGLAVEKTVANLEKHPVPRILNMLTFGLFHRFVTVQYVIVGRKA